MATSAWEFAQVLHQRVELWVDTAACTYHGVTTLYVRPPSSKGRSVAVHAMALVVEEVRVGDTVVSPHSSHHHAQETLDRENLAGVTPLDVADHATHDYRAALKTERLVGDLFIPLGPEPQHVTDGAAAGSSGDVAMADVDSLLSSAAGASMQHKFQHCSQPFRELLLSDPQLLTAIEVSIRFSKHSPDSAALFHAGFFNTDMQLYRSRAIFPCVDLPNSLHTWEFHVHTGVSEVSVCSGALAWQKVLVTAGGSVQGAAAPAGARGGSNSGALDSKPKPVGRLFYFEQSLPVAPSQTHICVGQLAVVPQYQGSTNHLVDSFLEQTERQANIAGQDAAVMTHFGPPELMDLVGSTTQFMYLPFKAYQIACTVSFPLEQLQVVFVPSQLASTQAHAAAGCIVASSELLHSERHVEQALEAKIALALALARQWFGAVLQPKSSSDAWLVEGLAGLLADHFLKTWLGQNEVAYRRFKEREAVVQADDGQMPPLCPQNQHDYVEDDAGGTGGPGGQGQQQAGAGMGRPGAGSARLRKDPLSQMYGSEALDPCPIRRWKAVAVLRMLERKVGEDSFRTIVQAVCRNAVASIRGWQRGGRAGSSSARLLSTRRFLAECGQAAGAAKDVASFAERWVYGRGCPRIRAGFTYTKKTNTLVVALLQDGGPEVRAAAVAASAQRSKSETSGRGIKIAIYDFEGAVQEAVVDRLDAHVDACVCDVPLTSKLGAAGGRRGGRKKGGDAGEGDDADDRQAQAAPEEVRTMPVQWLRVDPGQEWLAQVEVNQSEAQWIAQLRHSKDVVGQSLAVKGLLRKGLNMEEEMGTDVGGIKAALLDCVRSPGVYCRVRIEAARVLAAFSASLSVQPAAPNLLSFFYEHCRDPRSGLLKPNYWPDLGTQLLLQVIPLCIASIRDESFNSPPEAMQLVTDILANNDNSENLYDDGTYLGAVVEAAGAVRPSHASQLGALLRLVDGLLLRECLRPSHNYVVGVACLHAMTQLALAVKHTRAEAKALELYGSVRKQLLRFADPSVTTAAAAVAPHLHAPNTTGGTSGRGAGAAAAPHHLMRRAAYQCLLRIEAAEARVAKVLRERKPPRGAAAAAAAEAAAAVQQQHGPTGQDATPVSRLVALAMTLLAKEPLPPLRQAVMTQLLALLGQLQAQQFSEASDAAKAERKQLPSPSELVLPLSPSLACTLYDMVLGRTPGQGHAHAGAVGHKPPATGAAAPPPTPPTASPAPVMAAGSAAAGADQQQQGLLLDLGVCASDTRERHMAFCALQVVASQPPTLYRGNAADAEEEDIGPEASNITGRNRTQATGLVPPLAGTAGQARSMGTAGQPTTTHGTAAAAAASSLPAVTRVKIQIPTKLQRATGPPGGLAAAASGATGGTGVQMSPVRSDRSGGQSHDTVMQQAPGAGGGTAQQQQQAASADVTPAGPKSAPAAADGGSRLAAGHYSPVRTVAEAPRSKPAQAPVPAPAPQQAPTAPSAVAAPAHAAAAARPSAAATPASPPQRSSEAAPPRPSAPATSAAVKSEPATAIATGIAIKPERAIAAAVAAGRRTPPPAPATAVPAAAAAKPGLALSVAPPAHNADFAMAAAPPAGKSDFALAMAPAAGKADFAMAAAPLAPKPGLKLPAAPAAGKPDFALAAAPPAPKSMQDFALAAAPRPPPVARTPPAGSPGGSTSTGAASAGATRPRERAPGAGAGAGPGSGAVSPRVGAPAAPPAAPSPTKSAPSASGAPSPPKAAASGVSPPKSFGSFGSGLHARAAAAGASPPKPPGASGGAPSPPKAASGGLPPRPTPAGGGTGTSPPKAGDRAAPVARPPIAPGAGAPGAPRPSVSPHAPRPAPAPAATAPKPSLTASSHKPVPAQSAPRPGAPAALGGRPATPPIPATGPSTAAPAPRQQPSPAQLQQQQSSRTAGGGPSGGGGSTIVPKLKIRMSGGPRPVQTQQPPLPPPLQQQASQAQIRPSSPTKLEARSSGAGSTAQLAPRTSHQAQPPPPQQQQQRQQAPAASPDVPSSLPARPSGPPPPAAQQQQQQQPSMRPAFGGGLKLKVKLPGAAAATAAAAERRAALPPVASLTSFVGGAMGRGRMSKERDDDDDEEENKPLAKRSKR